MRWLLRVETIAVLLAGIPLFLGTEETDKYFAWTIQPPVTAAFLGLAVPAVLVFSVLGLAATLLHIDRFHLESPIFVARAVAWAWLAIYVLVPPATLILWVRQMRVEGSDPPRRRPLPMWFRAALVAQAVVLIVLGAALFISPPTVAPLWPWALTPLTARVVGAWLVGLGIAAAHAAWEGDGDRIRIGLLTYATAAVLVIVALTRYRDAMDWTSPGIVVLVAFAASMLGIGIAGLSQSPGSRSGQAAG